MSNFGPDPKAFFDTVYLGAAPWDIGAAQPALTELFAAVPPEGPALDVGCGSGDHVIALATLGLQALGIDFVAAAIDLARARAASLPPVIAARVEFQVADGLQPALLNRSFGTVVDSGFFHLFEPERRAGYIESLGAAIRPGGRYYLLAFAIEFPIPNSPYAITQDEVRARFIPEQGWRISVLREAQFQSRVAPVSATCACIERLAAEPDM